MINYKSNIFIGAALIIFAAVLKAVTFPASFNPIIAISLFSGVVISDKKLAFLMPLLAMFVSDIILEVFNIAPGFYGMGQIGNYISLMLVTVLGFGIKKVNAVNVVGFSLASSLLFFLLSNTNVFFFDTIAYEKSISGYMTCLAAGIPFIKNGLITDLFFSAVLFGSYQLLYKGQSKKIISAS
jgi:hypothetical protein